MNISKSAAHRIMLVVLMVIALLTMAFSVNAGHVHANAATNNPQVTVQNNKNNNGNNANQKFNRIYKVAKSKLGDRYSWGATGPKHFDCSGFTQYIYRKGIHKSLPRIAGAQYYDAKKVSKAHRKAGDLVFFGSSRHNISHVGMYIGHGKMIDAQLRGVIVEKVSAPWWHAVGYSRPANLN